MAKQKEEYTAIITPVFRASFPNVFQARKVNQADPNEKAKFSVQMIFRTAANPKDPTEKVVDLAPLKAAVCAIFAKQLGPNWAQEIQKRKGDGALIYRTPFRDGNAAEKKDTEGYGPGTIFAAASSGFKPRVLNEQKQEILNPQDFYGGCYAIAQITPHWYSVLGNQGVSFWLNNVMKMKDGVPFSGRESASEAFDAIPLPEGATPAAAAAMTGDPLGNLM